MDTEYTIDRIKAEALEFVSDSTLIESDNLIVRDVGESDPFESWLRAIGLLLLFADTPAVNPLGLCPDALAAHMLVLLNAPVIEAEPETWEECMMRLVG